MQRERNGGEFEDSEKKGKSDVVMSLNESNGL